MYQPDERLPASVRMLKRVQAGVHDAAGPVHLRSRDVGHLILPEVEQHVLRVPELDGGVAPDPRADGVNGLESLICEHRCPFVLPTLVDVPCATLVRDCGRKQHCRRKSRQLCNEDC